MPDQSVFDKAQLTRRSLAAAGKTHICNDAINRTICPAVRPAEEQENIEITTGMKQQGNWEAASMFMCFFFFFFFWWFLIEFNLVSFLFYTTQTHTHTKKNT